MAYPYYNYSGAFIPGTLARAETVGVEFTSVQTGFALLSNQGTDTGVLNGLVVNTPYAPTALVDGAPVWFKPAFTNTGACTLNVNATGVRNLVGALGSAVQPGVVTAGFWYQAVWSAAQNAWVLTAPSTVLTSGTITISAAAPTHKVGLVAAGGVSLAAAPIDATFAIDQSIAPTWTGAHIFSSTITANGAVTVNAIMAITATSGNSLSVTGATNAYAQVITASSTSGQSYGLVVRAGTTSADTAFIVQNQAQTLTFLELFGDGHGFLGPSSSLGWSWNTAGAMTLAAPTSGVPLTITAPSGGGSATQWNSNVARGSGAVSVQFFDNTGLKGYWGYVNANDNMSLINTLNASLFLGTNGNSNIGVISAGNVTIAAPSSGIALTITGAGTAVTRLSSDHTAGIGLNFNDTNASPQSFDIGLGVGTGAATLVIFDRTNIAARLTLSSSGAFTISAPTASIALSINGAANQDTLLIQGSSTSAQSFGVKINAGTTSGDVALEVLNSGSTAVFFEIFGDGHGLLGPTSSLGASWSTAGVYTITVSGAANAVVAAGASNAGFYQSVNAVPALVMNSGGSNWGIVQNDASNLWSLATGSSGTVNGTKCLQWDNLTEVGIATPSSIGNLSAGMTQVGYMDTPFNDQSTGNYSLALTDRGKFINLGAHTYTIPANASVAFPIGTTILLGNGNNGGNATLNITTDTLRWVPSNTTGSRTLSNFALVTLYKITSTSWWIWGFGIT